MQVQPHDDDLVMEMVELAMARSPAEREAYVQSACKNDSELFAEVWKYIRWEERMQGFLLDPFVGPPSPENPFRVGEVLDGRFRIVREVARGGMGVVYEAVDQKLDRRIAIKTAKANFRKALPPEVRNATEISHPNICKIFEIHTASTDQGEVDFITMEFLEGETLDQRLRRGPLPLGEARAIARQISEGLAEAHRNHVIHGDLKSSNVMLRSGVAGPTRAVITDFGLARRTGAVKGSAQSGPLGGTPDYMAPELWSGEKPTVASDIYALGVILCELASRRRPHELMQSDVSTTVSELSAEPVNRKPPAIHPKWDPILARCLHPNPAKRFASADEVAVALTPPRSRWRVLGAVAAAVMLAVLSAVVTYRQAMAPVESESLAILPFAAAADSAPLAEGLLLETGDQLRHLKPGKKRLTLIPVADAIQNKVDEPAKARTMLGAKYVLHGTLRKQDGRILVAASLTDAAALVHLQDFRADYAPAELRNLPVALAGMVTATLRLSPLAVNATVNPAAYPDYAAGISLSRRNPTLDSAIPLLERAVAADPTSPLTHIKLAEAQWLKYLASKNEEWSQRALASLHDAEQLNPDIASVRFVSGYVNERQGQYEKAAADYLRAIELEPTYGDAWRRLGKVYEKSNEPARALSAYQKAIEAEPNYWRNYQDLGSFYFDRDEFDKAIEQYKKLVQVAPDLAASHYALAAPYINLGRYSDAENELNTALRLEELPVARETLGVSFLFQGRDREAIPHLKRAIEIGAPSSLYYMNLGTALRRAGEARESQEAYQIGKELAESAVTKNPRDAIENSNLAYFCARLGEERRAVFEAQRSLQISDKNNNVRWYVVLTYEALGRRDLTLPLLEDAPSSMLARLNRFPDLAELRADPRFKQLLVNHNIQ
jgi:tetratricopeptide (TPR) repeat protein/TolB-like protein